MRAFNGRMLEITGKVEPRVCAHTRVGQDAGGGTGSTKSFFAFNEEREETSLVVVVIVTSLHKLFTVLR